MANEEFNIVEAYVNPYTAWDPRSYGASGRSVVPRRSLHAMYLLASTTVHHNLDASSRMRPTQFTVTMWEKASPWNRVTPQLIDPSSHFRRRHRPVFTTHTSVCPLHLAPWCRRPPLLPLPVTGLPCSLYGIADLRVVRAIAWWAGGWLFIRLYPCGY